MRKIAISVAPVAGHTPSEDVANPLTPEAVAQEVLSAAQAGASIVHLHVRDARGEETSELGAFSHTLDLIRAQSQILIEGSTGGVPTLSLEERCACLRYQRVEIASLNMGSVNFGEIAFVNKLSDIRYWAGRMHEAHVLPALVIFEGGMIHNVAMLSAEGVLRPPLVYAFCLGIRGALPATVHNLYFLRGMLPADALWGVVHREMSDLSLLATAIGMGASFIRIGFEDSIHYAPGKVARSNAELVEKAAAMIRALGLEVASIQETREMLGITAI